MNQPKFADFIILLFFIIILLILILQRKETFKVNANSAASPWTVLLLGKSVSCGGIILNQNTILTAAHCVFKENINNLRVYVGVFDRTKLTKGCEISDVRIHPLFDLENLYHDIALIRLKRNIKYTENIQPIQLPEASPRFGEKAFVSGWGMLNDGRLSRWLRVFEVTITHPDLCVIKYGDDYNDNLQVCAGNLGVSLDFCIGDSGGPLYQFKKDKWIVIGLVSFTGEKCADGLPSVYTDVFGYKSWILANI